MYLCVSGGKKCSFCGKFGLLCFLETLVLRFALLLHYRLVELFPKIVNIIEDEYLPTANVLKYKQNPKNTSLVEPIPAKWKLFNEKFKMYFFGDNKSTMDGVFLLSGRNLAHGIALKYVEQSF